MANNADNSPHLVITGDGSNTLQSKLHSETYHSTFGAVGESIEVFITNSGVLKRLQGGDKTRILEIGFGTGLNFVLTAEVALQHRCSLDYEAIEYDLPPLPLIGQLLRQNVPQQAQLVEHLETYLKNLTTTNQQPPLTVDKNIKLTVRLENALNADLDESSFDAIYLDAFSSKSNPDLWTAPFLRLLHKTLKPEGILATYSVNRSFKDALKAADFGWKKLKGPPGKREVLIAYPTPTSS